MGHDVGGKTVRWRAASLDLNLNDPRLRPGPAQPPLGAFAAMTVRCPDCGQGIELPPGVKSGDLLDCPNCAGHALRITEEGGQWAATLAYRVSCPDCEAVLTLSEDAK